MNLIEKKCWYLITQFFYKHRFKNIGKKSLIVKPIQLDNVGSIEIEDNVYIAEGAWLMGNKDKDRTITIKNGTTIGHFSHIIGLNSVLIQENVLIADRVFISDCTHSYEDLNIPILKQEVRFLNPVSIGEGSWIGENVCVCGAKVGKHCVIGANSVVISDIPDYCVAVGAPAKVVKDLKGLLDERK